MCFNSALERLALHQTPVWYVIVTNRTDLHCEKNSRYRQIYETLNHHSFNKNPFIKQITILELFFHLKCFRKYTEAKRSCLGTQNGPNLEKDLPRTSPVLSFSKNIENFYTEKERVRFY